MTDVDMDAVIEGMYYHGYYDFCDNHDTRRATAQAGEVILRGEIEEKIESDISYLRKLRAHVDAALASRHPDKALAAISRSPFTLESMPS